VSLAGQEVEGSRDLELLEPPRRALGVQHAVAGAEDDGESRGE
jgi:hypothetical protein